MYSVNDINFHPIHGTFSTCGSDGGLNFWNKEDRIRLKGELLDIVKAHLTHYHVYSLQHSNRHLDLSPRLPSTGRGRYSPMPSRTTGRKDTPG